jgi:hypothetical protein
MLLLGVQAGFGNSDVRNLPLTALDLDKAVMGASPEVDELAANLLGPSPGDVSVEGRPSVLSGLLCSVGLLELV